MSLFQKKTVEHSLNFSLNKPLNLIIVGLGNLGDQYELTRHNIGFDCLNELQLSQSEFTPWQNKKDLSCYMSSATFANTKVLLIKPTTLMNNSGRSVMDVLNYYKLHLKNLVVVHDDKDINFGQIKSKVGGGSAGHNGIKSISDLIGEDYSRIRVGINNEAYGINQYDTASFVLSKFTKTEQSKLSLLKREVQNMLIEFIYRGNLVTETRNFLI